MQATWTWKSQFETPDALQGSDAQPFPSLPNALRVEGRSFSCSPLEMDSRTIAQPQKKSGAAAVLAQAPAVVLALQFWNWLSARWNRSTPLTPRPAMRTLSHLALGGRKTITLVEVDGQRYLIGGGADAVTSIVAVTTMVVAPTEDASSLLSPLSSLERA